MKHSLFSGYFNNSLNQFDGFWPNSSRTAVSAVHMHTHTRTVERREWERFEMNLLSIFSVKLRCTPFQMYLTCFILFHSCIKARLSRICECAILFFFDFAQHVCCFAKHNQVNQTNRIRKGFVTLLPFTQFFMAIIINTQFTRAHKQQTDHCSH